MHKYIFNSYAFGADGIAHKLKNEEVAQELKNEGLAWVHLDGNSKQSKKWLEREVSYLDHLIIDALFAEEARPRIIEFEEGMLVILRGVNLDPQSSDAAEDLASIRLWIDNSRIISIQKRNFSAIFNVAKKIELGKKIKNSPEFLYNLIYENLLLISPLINDLNEKMDLIEEKMATSNYDYSLRESVAIIRKKVAIFKRYILPQKDVLSHLKSHDNDWIDDWARRHFQENHEQITNIIEELDEARDRSQIVHEEISNAIADKLNKNMMKISLIASIFMSLSFIASLFGMNLSGIPGSENPNGFYITVTIMLIALISAIFGMRHKKLL